MCIYTKRLYHCWCVDYYIKFANRCTASLRSDKECPRPPYLNKCEVEKVGLCPFHQHEEEAKLVAAGIPNPGYTKPEAEVLQQAETVVKTRYSDPNPEVKSTQGFVEAESGPRGSGIRTSKTFPQSPPPAAPYRRSDPVLERRGVPNPWTTLPQQLQRSKTSAQAPLPPPRPESFQQPPSQEPKVAGVPNPWILSPKKLQRSKTSAQAPPPPLPQRPGSFQQLPSEPLFTPLPTPLHRSNTATTASTYLPIHASHLQRASTYTPPTSSTSRNAAAKPVQVAIRDSRGFFIPPSVYQEPPPPSPPPLEPDLEPSQLEFVNLDAKIQRSSTYSNSRGSRSSFQIDPQIDAQVQRSSTYSERRSSRSSRNSTSIQAESPPILLVRRVSTAPTPERRSRVLDPEKERRKSNRVSFVYQKSDDEDDDEGEEMYPAPLQMQRRAGEMGEEGRGQANGEETMEDYKSSGDGLFAAQLQPQPVGMGGERKERRKSIGRQNVGMGMPGPGSSGAEQEILYSGSDYDGGEDGEIDILPVVNRDGGNVEREEVKGRRKSVRRESGSILRQAGFGLTEEEILYSGSDYDAGEDSDDSILPPRDDNVETRKGKGNGNGEERRRRSVLFEMLYAHASQPQFQSQAASGSLEERREKRMSIKPLALGGKKGVGGGKGEEGEGKEGMGMEIGTDSEYETEYVDTD